MFLYKRATKLLSTTEQITLESIPFCVIHPNSKFKKFWNWINALILLYTAIATPFLLSFYDSNEPIFIIDNTVNGLFFIDFVLNFTTAYYTTSQELVSNRKEIVTRYMKSWMIVDLLSWIPFDLIQGQYTTSGSRAFARFLRLPKLYRLLRFSRLLKLMKSHFHNEMLEKIQELLSLKSSAIRYVKSYAMIIILIHMASCFWYLCAKLYDFSPDTWVYRNNYLDADIGTLYLSSLYWALATISTVGYGDITPVTTLEILLCICWMAFGLYFFSFTIGNLTSLMSSLDIKDNALTNKLSVIDEYAADVDLDKSLKEKLKKSLKYSADSRGFSWTEKINLLNEFPKQLRYEIAIAMFQGAAKMLKFFMNKDQGLVAIVVPLLRPMQLDHSCYVYRSNDISDEIYFLLNGTIRIIYGEDLVVSIAKKGKYFGDIEIVRACARRFEAYSTSYCEILIMHRHILTTIKEEYCEVWAELCEKALKREKKFEKIILHVQEMEKFHNGALNFVSFKYEFSRHIENLLEKRIKEFDDHHKEISLGSLIKKLDILIKSKRLRRNKQAQMRFLEKFDLLTLNN